MISRLKLLDIHYHFVSPEMVQKLRDLGLNVNADDPQEPDHYGDEEYRYIFAAE